jgi:hypothetical protein
MNHPTATRNCNLHKTDKLAASHNTTADLDNTTASIDQATTATNRPGRSLQASTSSLDDGPLNSPGQANQPRLGAGTSALHTTAAQLHVHLSKAALPGLASDAPAGTAP